MRPWLCGSDRPRPAGAHAPAGLRRSGRGATVRDAPIARPPSFAAMLDHLFTPLALGPAELPCRIVSTAHQTTLIHDHLPTDDFLAYQQARARGGAGLIVMEAVAIAPSGLLTGHSPALRPGQLFGHLVIAAALGMFGGFLGSRPAARARREAS